MPDLSDAVLQRRFRTTCQGLERAGADEDTAQLVASIILHYEQRRRIKVEQAEVMALTGVLALITRNLNERAGR